MTKPKLFQNSILLLLAISVVLILASCQTRQSQKNISQETSSQPNQTKALPQEEPADPLEKLLLDLKNTTQLNLGPMDTTFFNWNLEGEENIVSQIMEGKGYTAVGVHDTQVIADFFFDNSFHQDILNTLANSKYNTTGFNLLAAQSSQANDIACLLTRGKDDENDPNTIQGIIQIQCAVIEPATIPPLSKNKQIKKHLAQKYNTTIGDISLTLNQESGNYIQGEFSISSQKTELAFLGTVYGGQWYAVFSGSGQPSCRTIRAYQFPEDMNIDCVEPLEPLADVDDDIDGQGCEAPLGYIWCETKSKCIRPWKEDCDSTESKPIYTNSNEEKAIELAKQFVLKSQEYQQGKSSSLLLTNVEQGLCPGCWSLGYRFDRESQENEKDIVSLKVTIENWEIQTTETDLQTIMLLSQKDCQDQNGIIVVANDCAQDQNNIGEINDTENFSLCCVSKNN
ncbi:hypothetical protein ACFLZ9_01670 [Patescibacteria group bacterium]